MALYMERLKKGVDPEGEAQKFLQEAKDAFLHAGVAESLITTKATMGNPSEEIMKEAGAGDYSLIVMGRKGRTALKELLLGGVSSTVLQRCAQPTIVLVSA